jgi:CDP-diacylglycerol--serine O-phosphatidyltransferase
MVSRLRYRSMKGIEMRRRQPFALLIALTLVVLLIASEPSLVVFSFFFLYALSGLIRTIPFVRRRLPEPAEQVSGGERRT